MSKISTLPGYASTPEVFCAKLMEVSCDIKNIAVVVSFKDSDNEPGDTKVFSTKMKAVDVAWLRWCFDQDFRPDEEGE